MKEIFFYEISTKYLDYLSEFDQKVPKEHANGKSRKFIGILLAINDTQYFAPMSSPKDKHKSLSSDMPDLYKIKNGEYGVINLNNMIPVPIECANKIDIKNETDEKYKILLNDQQREIKKDFSILVKKASKLHKIIKSGKNENLQSRCCNFSLLEEKSKEYSKQI